MGLPCHRGANHRAHGALHPLSRPLEPPVGGLGAVAGVVVPVGPCPCLGGAVAAALGDPLGSPHPAALGAVPWQGPVAVAAH